MTRKIKCPDCKGKGTRLSITGKIMYVNPFTLPLMLLDRNFRENYNDDICNRCDGEGYIEVEYDYEN